MTRYLTRQQIFDKAVGGVIAQGGASIRFDGARYEYGPAGTEASCQYRSGPTDTERSCAVGQLIDDRFYDPNLEGEVVDHGDGILFTKILPSINLDRDMDFITKLQICHDQATENAVNDTDFLHSFRSAAKEVGEDYNLTTEILDA